MGWAIAIAVTVVALGILILLYFAGNKMQQKQLEQREQINAAAQSATLFIIDKKIMPMKDAKLPKAVMEQAPKRYQRAKVPIVKAKVGPQVMTLLCDESIYDDVPQHGEVKAMISGIYITSVKTLHKTTKKMQQEEATNGKRKKTLREKMVKRQAEYQKQLDYELANKKSKEDAKKKKAEEKKKREREKKITV
ncbi:MAG: hypothetical protein K6F55_08115 [Eubacterium sp.]|nr:hypothetical protein [Eubacterium sp.]